MKFLRMAGRRAGMIGVTGQHPKKALATADLVMTSIAEVGTRTYLSDFPTSRELKKPVLASAS